MQQLTRLLDVMSKLRDPVNGCPWDLEQDYKSLVPYTLEEAYEVAEAIELEDMVEVKKELGDLLFQVVFYAQIAKEEGLFDFEEVAGGIADKMVERHPHVFSDHQYENEAEFLKAWEEQKEQEKKQAQMEKENRASEDVQLCDEPVSLMDGISKILPATTRAVKIQKKAAQVGFDWDIAEEVIPVISEEIKELSVELNKADPEHERIEDELGDVLFSCVNLARKLKIDPEKALRMSNHKFSQRFRKMEQSFQFNREKMEQASFDEMNETWQSAKHRV
ncbi:MAG: nucleoside triphosphate pyrophosphohydrolase [Gammaproteobacteria bacterium]|nr:nucleoside triphosphate pyrophosphohydrolase [Gammaproteobacteria bacterium]